MLKNGMRFKIKQTSKKGKGVFTTKNFRAGDFVCVLSGERMTSKKIDARIDAGEETCDDPLQISRRMYIDLDELPRTINHSCNPNCGIKRENKLYALRDIFSDEELSYDYSTTVPKYKSWWKMRCHCHSKNCRGVISSYDKISKEQLRVYMKLGVLPLWVRKFDWFDE